MPRPYSVNAQKLLPPRAANARSGASCLYTPNIHGAKKIAAAFVQKRSRRPPAIAVANSSGVGNAIELSTSALTSATRASPTACAASVGYARTHVIAAGAAIISKAAHSPKMTSPEPSGNTRVIIRTSGWSVGLCAAHAAPDSSAWGDASKALVVASVAHRVSNACPPLTRSCGARPCGRTI